ncbi:MAG: sulfite exporter TauE/SafE family protein [Lentisphaeria bacterium]
MILENYTLIESLWIALPIFFLGMSKGGFPIGIIALPLLILIWPGEGSPVKQIVAFMLPLLCTMDIVAVIVYRKHIQWRRMLPLLPGSLVGVAIGSLFFFSENSALISISDRWLKLMVGVIGILFVIYKAVSKWLVPKLREHSTPSRDLSIFFGTAAGTTSTLAHAAGPLAQMYFLMGKLPKMQFAATLAGYFFLLNLTKLIPFIAIGRLNTDTALLSFNLLPVVPLGVATGYGLVRCFKSKWYIAFIHAILFITAITLIYEALMH